MYDVLFELSKKTFVINVFGWTSGSLDGTFVIFALKLVAMPLKCQQNVVANLKWKKNIMRICFGQLTLNCLLYETFGFIDRAVVFFDKKEFSQFVIFVHSQCRCLRQTFQRSIVNILWSDWFIFIASAFEAQIFQIRFPCSVNENKLKICNDYLNRFNVARTHSKISLKSMGISKSSVAALNFASNSATSYMLSGVSS